MSRVSFLVVACLLVSACGGSKLTVAQVLDCSTPNPLELVMQLRDELLNDGGTQDLRASKRLVRVARALGEHYGRRALLCALDEAGSMLRDHEMTMKKASSFDYAMKDASLKRHADLTALLEE